MVDGGLGTRLRPFVPRVVLRQLATDPGTSVTELDATVALFDLSGFTELAERLQRLGREGAEHLVTAIDTTFARLLTEADEHGGSLLKFGGDALLLLFQGEDHAARACRSAACMHRALERLGPIEARDERIELRMSAGVHSGRFHLFLVGGAYRELLTTGPAWSTVVRMERHARAGEVLLSDATARALPARHTVAARPGARVLTGIPDARRPGPEPEGWRLDPRVIAGALPSAVAAYAAAGRQAPEHRVVTVAFVAFAGTDALIERDGAQAAAAELAALVRDVSAAADAHGIALLGSDVDADGGRFMLTAGAPIALDDPEERMLLALRRIVERDGRIPVRAGVNCGPTFAGVVGPARRRTYTTMGDTTNLAARLAAGAAPGTILAAPAVLEHSATAFDATALAPFAVKGKQEPVRAWTVGPALGRAARGSAGPAVSGVSERFPLIGRERELALLGAAVADAREGRGRLVEIVSEPGLGKTRLLEELELRARGLRHLRATCEAYTAQVPYGAWREPLRWALGIARDAPADEAVARLRGAIRAVDPALERWLPVLAVPLGVPHPDAPPVPLPAAPLHDAVTMLVPAVVHEPFLLEFEDVHLMDRASAELLRALVERLRDWPLLVAVTRRDDQQGFVAPAGEGVLRLQPAPLTPAQTLELARRATERAALPEPVLALAAERSDGNPQFLRDLLRAAAAGAEELPASIEAAALARLDRLAADDRALVRCAAVLGVGFDTAVLGGVLDDDAPRPDDVTWWRLSRYFADEGGGRRRFRRAVVREVAYATLPFRTRRELHARAGRRLEQQFGGDPAPDQAAALALHFSAAGDEERAARYARMAARRSG